MKIWFKYLSKNVDARMCVLAIFLFFTILPISLYFIDKKNIFMLYFIFAIFAIFAIAISLEDWTLEYKKFKKEEAENL